MHMLRASKAWLLVIVLSVFAGGCGREQTGFVAPTVISTNPANLATGVPVTQIITVTFSEPMDPATINTATFTVASPGGLVSGAVVLSGATATFSPAANLFPSTTYTGTITTGAKDPVGNALTTNFVWTFTTGAIPTVTSTIPANGATGVPLNQAISATFSEPMNPATITTTTFTVNGPGATAVAGAVTYVAASNTAIFTPAANLTANTVYTATITTGAMSAGGDALAANFVWTFKTGATTNSSAPTIISTNPANGAMSVPINQKVAAIFSAAMNPATINGTTFTVTGPGATLVAGTVTYSAGSNTAVFTPTTNLAPSTTFTATVTNGAQDLAGNALGPGAVPNPWTFTTGAATNSTAPTITLTNPANVATGVPLNATVNATFSEAMDPTTLTSATFTLTEPPGATSVTGTVTYAAASDIATFTPASPLAANTQYTATVTNGAKDLFGNALASGAVPNPWLFTTGPPFTGSGPGPINLGSDSTFGAFGGTAGITNQGINTEINNGNIGTTAVSTAVTGFHDTTLAGSPPPCSYTETPLNIGVVNGEIFTAAPPPTVGCPTEGTAATFATAQQAAADALTAYNSMVALPPGSDPGAGQLGGLTLAPGTYTAAGGSFLLTGSDLTLDAQGNANAVWVFQMATSLTVGAPGAPRSVILINGAQAQNVFWQVGSAATINGAGGGTMVGTIIAMAGITFSTAGNNAPPFTVLDGRALVLVGPVTMVNTVINVP
jgi:ice-binding like protein/Big-like domain-containing protein